MMEYIRYYPLIGMDTDGKELQAMTPTDSESTVREHHKLWLTEIIPHYFRLGAQDKPPVDAVKAIQVHCPKCGGVLRSISTATKEHPYPLYACDKCSIRTDPGAV